jgi:ribosome-associated translation inhibitor RaiA
MKIQFNTDKTVAGDKDQQIYFSELIEKKLDRFQSHITRIEVHVSDVNGKKEGPNDIQCVLEVRMQNRTPLAVTCEANTTKNAVSGAIDKAKASMDTILGKLQSNNL